jgi:hypothetical protein
MSKHFNLREKIFFSLLVMALGMTSCVQGVHDPGTMTTTLNPETTGLTDTASTSPPESLLTTEMATTLTPQADDRRGSYLFPSDIDEEIAEVIQLALEERLSYSHQRGERFFSYVLLKPLEKTDDGVIKAYLYVENHKYYVDHGELKEGGGGDIPAAVIMEKKEDGWRVEVETPIAGQWGSSIREIFPEEVLPLLFNSPPIPYEAIDENIIQQAEEHFGLIFDSDKNSFPPKDSTPTPSVRILTLTPTPTLDISTLEPDVSARVFITDEYILIGVDLYREVGRPFQKGLLSSNWRVYLYQRQADHNYVNQDVLVLDDLKDSADTGHLNNEFYVKVPLDKVQNHFGDRRDLFYQIVNEKGDIAWQDEIYLDHDLSRQYPESYPKIFPEDYPEIVRKGIVIGYPNLLSINIAPVFLPSGKFIPIKEPRGGFYGLDYRYNFGYATGITATVELQKISDELVIEVIPYREDGLFTNQRGTVLSGEISGVSGILQANFPHEWLDNKRDNDQKFYLRIADEDGNIYKEAYIHFIPYAP